LAVVIHALACAALFETPNHRRLTWDGASAVMEIPDPEQGYASLWIGLTEPTRELSVRLPDGRWLRTKGLEPASLESYASPLLGSLESSGVRRIVVPFDRGRCESGLGFVGGSILFEFQSEALIRVQLSSNVSRPEPCRPGLGDGDGVPAYVMPLSEDQLVELLGPYLRKEEYFGGL
jgi:hypothetical protein